MRILFATTGGVGHFHPLVPLAQATRDRGHEVAFAGPDSFSQYIVASGFKSFASRKTGKWPGLRSILTMIRLATLAERKANAYYFLQVFVEIATRTAVPTLLNQVCPRWHPDIIVRESFEFAGAVAAEKLGLPHAAVQVGFQPHPYELEPQMGSRLDRIRKKWGLSSNEGLAMLYRYSLLAFVPPSYQDARTLAIPTLHSLRPVIFDRSGPETLPAWVNETLPHPVIYLTLGTEMTRLPGVFPKRFDVLIDGLQEVAGTLIVSVGRDMDPGALKRSPPHVFVERYIPQSLLLPYCDLVVTHGGHNTVLASLHQGLPLVIVPITADQPDNAARCEALGLGLNIPNDGDVAAGVRAGAAEVLRDPKYRQNARKMREEMQSLQGLQTGVDLLEELAEPLSEKRERR